MSDPVTLSLLGSIATGVGSAWAAKSQRKAEEKAEIARETRREERYAGIGDAASVKDPTQAERQLGRAERNAQRVGSRPDRVGSRYDRGTDASGLGRRPKPDMPSTADIPSAVSVSQGAAPITMGNAGGGAPTGEAPVTASKPRYSYNPQTQRIDFGPPQQSGQAAGLPQRPMMSGG